MPNSRSLPMAAVGNYDAVLPFQAVGIKPVILDTQNRNGIGETLEQLAQEGHAVVFIQEDIFIEFLDVVGEINDTYPTSIVPLPGLSGSTGAGLASIRSSVEKAVGMDIFAER